MAAFRLLLVIIIFFFCFSRLGASDFIGTDRAEGVGVVVGKKWKTETVKDCASLVLSAREWRMDRHTHTQAHTARRQTHNQNKKQRLKQSNNNRNNNKKFL